MIDVDASFTALADPIRRELVRLLNEPRQPSELAEALQLSRPATSRHLKVLREAGMVEIHTNEEDARTRTVSLKAEGFEPLRQWLDEVEAFWGTQLAAFKRHAERKKKRR
ncbi:MAG: metalloregulator ArsR/SmtB family transcription factor [Myxococcota bacterium]